MNVAITKLNEQLMNRRSLMSRTRRLSATLLAALAATAAVAGCARGPAISAATSANAMGLDASAKSRNLASWKDDIIYFVLTDRFHNGNKQNDFNVKASDPNAYHGGDLDGIIQKLPYIKNLGASEVLERSAFSSAGKPLGRERWAGAVDVVGSHTLANVCATTRYRGIVTACGLAGGMDFPATVAPFILRGVTLVGVDSVMCPRADRLVAWQRLGTDLDISKLNLITHEIGLAEAIPMATRLLDGQVRGRIVVDVNN